LALTSDPAFRSQPPEIQAAMMTGMDFVERMKNPVLRYARRKAAAGKYEIVDTSTGSAVRTVKTKSAAIQVVTSMNAKASRNPESSAAALYEEFHGKPPGETLEIVTEKHEHDWLVQLGVLVELKVATVSNLDASIRFTGKDAPQLCSSEDGRQLYIEGGDQALDLEKFRMAGKKWLKDSMVIGVLGEVTYQTQKGFQKFKLTDYYHKLGEESGVQPHLLYSPRDKLLSVSGGQYEVRPEGIVN
jgi:hypothetical protein